MQQGAIYLKPGKYFTLVKTRAGMIDGLVAEKRAYRRTIKVQNMEKLNKLFLLLIN